MNRQSKSKKALDILDCVICHSSPKDPRLCPKCKKLFCLACIERWHTLNARDYSIRNSTAGQRKHQCGHCKSLVQVTDYLKIPWIEEVVKTLVQTDNSKNCSIHPLEELSIYCSNCKAVACAICVFKHAPHSGHEVESIDDVFEQKKKELLKMNLDVERQKSLVKDSITDLNSKVQIVLKAKDAHLKENVRVLESMKTKVEAEFDSKILPILGEKEEVQRCLEDLGEQLLSLEGCLLPPFKKDVLIETNDSICGNIFSSLANSQVKISQLKYKDMFFGPEILTFSNSFAPAFESVVETRISCADLDTGMFAVIPGFDFGGRKFKVSFSRSSKQVMKAENVHVVLNTTDQLSLETHLEFKVELQHPETRSAFIPFQKICAFTEDVTHSFEYILMEDIHENFPEVWEHNAVLHLIVFMRHDSYQQKCRFMESQNQSLKLICEEQESRKKAQESQIRKQESQMREQEFQIREQESKIKEQESRISVQESSITEQKSMISTLMETSPEGRVNMEPEFVVVEIDQPQSSGQQLRNGASMDGRGWGIAMARILRSIPTDKRKRETDEEPAESGQDSIKSPCIVSADPRPPIKSQKD